jgi:hypothetical protein
MGMKTRRVEMCCLPDCKSNFKRMEEAIDAFLEELKQANGEENGNFFAIVILDRRNDYPRVKAMLTRLDILS